MIIELPYLLVLPSHTFATPALEPTNKSGGLRGYFGQNAGSF